MARRKLAGLLSLGLVLAVPAISRATLIQDLTTHSTIFFDNFEGTTPVSTAAAPDTSGNYQPNHAVLGTWINSDGGILPSSQVTNATAAPDPGPAQGSNYLRLYRSDTYNAGTEIGAGPTAVTTIGDVIKLSTMVYVSSAADLFARVDFLMVGTTTGSGLDFQTTPAFVIGDGSGNVIAFTGNGSGTGGFIQVPTGLHYATNTWQEWDLTYTIGSALRLTA